MKNQYPLNSEIIKESFRMIKKDKSIVKYAIIKTIIFAILFIFAVFLFSFLVQNGNLLNLIEKLKFNSGLHAFSAFFLFILFLLFFLFVNSFIKIAVMYNSYTRLQGRPSSFSEGLRRAREKVWEVFKASIIGPFQQRILGISRWGEKEVANIKGKKTEIQLLPDISFMIPLMIFENLSRKEAILQSFHLFTKHFQKVTFAQLREGGYYILLGVLGFVAIFISIFTMSLPLIIIVIGIVLIYWAFLGILRSVSYSIFLVVLYYYIKRAEK